MALILNGDTGITYPVATATSSATQASAGRVLQVVTGTYAVETSIASSTYADTGLSASITPSVSTSKILIIVSQVCATYIATNTNNYVKLQLFRGASSIVTYPTVVGNATGTNGSGYQQILASINVTYLDSPSSTSSLTYKTQGACTNTASSGASSFQTNNTPSYITLMEISA